MTAMFERKQESLTTAGLKVGILFNQPAKPPRGEAIDYVAESEIEEQVEAVQEALEKLNLQYDLFALRDDIESLVRALRSDKPDAVINLCEGAFGDSHLEMNVPSLLELLGIPYTGSFPLALGICQNKGFAKDILRANGIPTPKYEVLSNFKEWKDDLDYPLFVKPLNEDASVGISSKSYIRNEDDLRTQVEYISKQYRQPALVEEYIAGRELNVAILGNENPKALPISEIVFGSNYEPRIVSYSAKWFAETEEYKMTKPMCPADLKPSLKSEVEKIALKAYEALHCRDYARVDIRLKDELPLVLEINPNPDVSLDAGFARSLKAAGIPYEEFIRMIIFFALERAAQMKA